MSFMFHQLVRRFVPQVLAIFFIILTSAVSQAAQVTLAWDPNNPAPDGYRVFLRNEGETYNYASPAWPLAGDNPQSTTCTIGDLTEDTQYYFVVRAVTGDDISGDSNEVAYHTEAETPLSYSLSAAAGAHGSISPGTVTVIAGDSQTFTITPDPFYHIVDVLVDGQSIGPTTSYTFGQVSANHTISAAFATDTFTISAGAGAHGGITPAGGVTVNYGSSQTFAISPDTGYHVADVLVDGQSVGALQSYTFNNVTASHAVEAIFEADAFTISASAGDGGTISPSGQIQVAGGADQSFIVTADEGYEIQNLVVDGNSIDAQDSYAFTNVLADHAITATFVLANQPPVSDAGPDQVADEAQVVTLSGLNSHDPDDGIVQFEWRQIQGDPVVLSSPEQETTTFTTPDVDMNGQSLVFELTVTDTHGATAKDTCIVNVTWVNEAPIAGAGADQNVSEGSEVTLDATASMDADDGIGSYSWLQVQGPQVVLSDPQSATPHFTAPDVGREGASLVFELTVTDAGGLQDTDTCAVTVTWNNIAPVADAGPDQQVAAGNEVTLDGSQSVDPDGASLLYHWSQTDGQPVVLSDATAASPVFTVPVEGFDGAVLTFQLTVTDDGGLQGGDACQVVVQAGSNVPPDEDTVSPVLTILNPAQDYTEVSDSRINITGTATDNTAVDRVIWSNDRGQSGTATGTDSWHIYRLRLHRGTNTYTITAYDATGNSQSKTITIELKSRWKWWSKNYR
jgi:hypothetical protein